MHSSSRLDYLLKAFEISGKDISRMLNIDETTVSKWRNNQRKLTYKSKYTAMLAEILLSCEIERKRHILPAILKNYRKDMNPQSRQQQIDALCLWLTEEPLDIDIGEGHGTPYIPRNGYNASVSVFVGENGVDEALEYSMKYVLNAPPGGTMYVIDFNGIDWTSGDESADPQKRINAGIELFKAFIENGQRFVIVDCNTDIYRPYKAIFRWMRLYLMDGVEVWTHPPISQDKNYFISFVLRNEMALHCISNSDFPEDRHCILFKNKESVNSFAAIAESTLQRAKKLMETVENNKILELVKVMEKQLKPERSIYVLNPSLVLHNPDRKVLEDILTENNVDGEKIKTCFTIRDNYAAAQQKCRYTAIFDLDMLERIFAADMTVDHTLSAICRKEVRVSRNHRTNLLRSITHGEDDIADSMIFVSFSYLGIMPVNLSIFVQDDTFVSVWDMERYKKSMYCINLDVISGFYRYLEDIWRTIPKTCKEYEWRNKQLERFIECD
ncbi:MAG: hypothetical protein LBU13_10035 [Synergistaceae bacterium]|jgi:transcriptional regulator with XRE-family HTH domain|nr:hypothetical protein [Synergistaceae bacterium]